MHAVRQKQHGQQLTFDAGMHIRSWCCSVLAWVLNAQHFPSALIRNAHQVLLIRPDAHPSASWLKRSCTHKLCLSITCSSFACCVCPSILYRDVDFDGTHVSVTCVLPLSLFYGFRACCQSHQQVTWHSNTALQLGQDILAIPTSLPASS